MATGKNNDTSGVKAYLFDIKRFAIHDGPGIRTTVFLKSCPLHCFWCHNPEGIDACNSEWIHERVLDGQTFTEKETIGRYVDMEEILHTIERDQAFYSESGGGVTFSGGEPLAQADFLIQILRRCKEKGIHTCVDTSGYASKEIFTQVLESCDLLLLDLKHADDQRHLEGTSVSNQPIIDHLNRTKAFSTPVWLRLPMVPGYNTDPESRKQMLMLLEKVKNPQIKQIHLLPFHQAATHKYAKCGRENKMAQVKSMSKADLIPFQEELRKAGWENVYLEG